MMNKKEKEYCLLSDTTFKYFLKRSEYKDWFDDIFKRFGLDLEGYEFDDNESNTGNKIKDYRFDLKLTNKEKNMVALIEANQSSENGTAELKAHFYLIRVVSELFMEGEEYKPKCAKLLMFNNFYSSKDKTLWTGTYRYPDKEYEENYLDTTAIYLPHFHKVCYDKIDDEVDKKLYLLGCSMKELKEMNTKDENMRIINEYKRLISEDKTFMYEYEREQDIKKMNNTMKSIGFEEGHNVGIEEGIVKGIEQGQVAGAKQANIETAKKMLIRGILTNEQIAEDTGLSLYEIKELKNELEK